MDARYQRALDRFIVPYVRDPRVLGIIVSGSVVYGEPMPHSDIDVHIIMRSGTTRTRGNVFVHDVEIEYFINPVKQICSYFKTEVKNRATAFMFANGVIIFSRGTEVDALVREARAVLRTAIPRMSSEERENLRYHIDDLHKDALDVASLGRDTEFNLVAAKIIDSCLTVVARTHRVPSIKLKRATVELASVDPAFTKLLKRFFIVRSLRTRVSALAAIVTHTERLLGGKRPRSWKLTGPLT